VLLHGPGEDDDAEYESDDDLAPQGAVRGGAECLFGVGRGFGAPGGRRLLDHVVACGAYCRRQVVARDLTGQVGDRGPLRGEVHAHVKHAGRPAQRSLHEAYAAGAGHAEDGQRLLRRHHAVACGLHGVHQLTRGDHGRVEDDGGLLCGEIHAGVADARRPAQCALVPRHAAAQVMPVMGNSTLWLPSLMREGPGPTHIRLGVFPRGGKIPYRVYADKHRSLETTSRLVWASYGIASLHAR
jgi:hypothetical protein